MPRDPISPHPHLVIQCMCLAYSPMPDYGLRIVHSSKHVSAEKDAYRRGRGGESRVGREGRGEVGGRVNTVRWLQWPSLPLSNAPRGAQRRVAPCSLQTLRAPLHPSSDALAPHYATPYKHVFTLFSMFSQSAACFHWLQHIFLL